jgi:hypothetical protein
VTIASSNRKNLDSAERIRNAVGELRTITERNLSGSKKTLSSTAGLSDRARELGEIMDTMATTNPSSIEQEARSRSRKRKSESAEKDQTGT